MLTYYMEPVNFTISGASGSAIIPSHTQDFVESVIPYFLDVNRVICEHFPESCNLGVKLLM